MKEKYLLEILSDLFTSLAAGWFATVLIFPGYIGFPDTVLKFMILTANFCLSIVSIYISFKLKEKSNL